MAEHIISGSGTQYPLIVNSDGSVNALLVDSSGDAIKITQSEENKLGSACSGSDGASNRVLTLANTTTSGGPVSVWVETTLIAGSDLTISHKAASSTVTFGIAINNTDVIRILYYV